MAWAGRLKIFLLTGIFLIAASVAAASGESKDISCVHCHSAQVQEFAKSIHYDRNISCMDCHGGDPHISGAAVSVSAMSTNFTGAPARINITETCSKCHSEVTGVYKESIHWKELEKGVTIAATCTDCHGVHAILPSANPNSSANLENVPMLCAGCHENQTKMSAWYYGIKTDRFDTYKKSYHYKALLSGGKGLATCTDCHENHNTRSESDPGSAIYAANLASTCGKSGCHPGNSAVIYGGKVHEGQSVQLLSIDTKALVTYFYIAMILFELVFTLGLIGLDITSKFDIRRRR